MKIPNQWHLTVSYTPSKANRVLTVISLCDENEEFAAINEKDGNIICRDWKIRAELDPGKPATLHIENDTLPVVLDIGNGAVSGNDIAVERKYPGSTILLDTVNGTPEAIECRDEKPLVTAVPK